MRHASSSSRLAADTNRGELPSHLTGGGAGPGMADGHKKRPARARFATLGSPSWGLSPPARAGTLAVAARLPGRSCDLPLVIASLQASRTSVLDSSPQHKDTSRNSTCAWMALIGRSRSLSTAVAIARRSRSFRVVPLSKNQRHVSWGSVTGPQCELRACCKTCA